MRKAIVVLPHGQEEFTKENLEELEAQMERWYKSDTPICLLPRGSVCFILDTEVDRGLKFHVC